MNELRELLQLAKTYVTVSYVMTGVFIFLNLVFLLRKPLRWQLNRKKEIEETKTEFNIDDLLTDYQKEQQVLFKVCRDFKPSCIYIMPYSEYFSLSTHKFFRDINGSIYILNSENVVIRQYLFCQVKFY